MKTWYKIRLRKISQLLIANNKFLILGKIIQQIKLNTLKIALIFATVTIILSTTCEDENCHKTIRFINNSDLTLYVTASSDYPDTTFTYDPNPILDPLCNKVSPMETNTGVLSVEDCAELYFQYFVPSDTLLVFVFDAEVLESTEWNTIIEKYLVLKRYKLSLNDLENMDWTITYP